MDQPQKKDKPCPDRFLVMPDESKVYSKVCKKCGWKEPDFGWHLRPVKFDNRYWFYDH
jgi:hypothetical protein